MCTAWALKLVQPCGVAWGSLGSRISSHESPGIEQEASFEARTAGGSRFAMIWARGASK